MNIALSEPTLPFLRWASKTPFGSSARRVLELTERRVEVAFGFGDWFDRQWQPKRRALERLTRATGAQNGRACHAFHGLYHFQPLHPKRRIFITKPAEFEESLKALIAQTRLAARLRPSDNGRVLVIQHAGYFTPESWRETRAHLVRLFRPVMEIARELDVGWSFETEPPSMLGDKIGTSLTRLAELVDCLNEHAPNDAPFASITLDTSHSLIAADGDYAALEREIDQHAASIGYLHVAYPVFHYAGQLAFATTEDENLSGPMRAYVSRARHLDGHRRIYSTPDGERFDDLVRRILALTPAGRFPCVTLEVVPRCYYLHHFRKKGCSSAEMLGSVLHLAQILKEQPDIK